MVLPKREFVIRHVMEDVSKIEEGQEFNVEEEHFGIPWSLWGCRWNDHLTIFLHCGECENTSWSMDTNLEFKLISPDGDSTNWIFNGITFSGPDGSLGLGRNDFISWEKLMDHFTLDNRTTIEIRVIIEKMEGCGREILRIFDESVKECSDVVLVVENRKFYLSKLFLALQSSYFKGLLLGNFKESKKEEVTLNEIDPDDFQNFLEVLHGEPAVDDTTVDGILCLADMYDAPTVLRRCEEFLMEKSKRPLKGKLELASRYNLEMLKEKCVSESKWSLTFAWPFPRISTQWIEWDFVWHFFAWLFSYTIVSVFIEGDCMEQKVNGGK